MKKYRKIFGLVVVFALLFQIGFIADITQVRAAELPELINGGGVNNSPALKVVGNKVVHADDPSVEVALRGVNIASLEWSPTIGGESVLAMTKYAMDVLDSNLIRLPVSREGWFFEWSDSVLNNYKLPNDYDVGGVRYREFVDQVIDEVSKAGKHIILDLHHYKIFDNQRYLDFWDDAAVRYKDNPTVLFGMLNEPHSVSVNVWYNGDSTPGNINKDGEMVSSVGHQYMVERIRKTGASNILLAGGRDWSNSLEHIADIPLIDRNLGGDINESGNGIIYDFHTYPGHGRTDSWHRKAGVVRLKHPVLIGEFGWVPYPTEPDILGEKYVNPNHSSHHSKWFPELFDWANDTDTYGNYANWTAFSFHPSAAPSMIERNTRTASWYQSQSWYDSRCTLYGIDYSEYFENGNASWSTPPIKLTNYFGKHVADELARYRPRDYGITVSSGSVPASVRGRSITLPDITIIDEAQPMTINVKNFEKADLEAGELSVELDDTSVFTLDKDTITVDSDGDVITITPRGDLITGTYRAVLSIGGDGQNIDPAEEYNISYTVKALEWELDFSEFGPHSAAYDGARFKFEQNTTGGFKEDQDDATDPGLPYFKISITAANNYQSYRIGLPLPTGGENILPLGDYTGLKRIEFYAKNNQVTGSGNGPTSLQLRTSASGGTSLGDARMNDASSGNNGGIGPEWKKFVCTLPASANNYTDLKAIHVHFGNTNWGGDIYVSGLKFIGDHSRDVQISPSGNVNLLTLPENYTETDIEEFEFSVKNLGTSYPGTLEVQGSNDAFIITTPEGDGTLNMTETETSSFIIKQTLDLPVGVYEDTITVTGDDIQQSFNIAFQVVADEDYVIKYKHFDLSAPDLLSTASSQSLGTNGVGTFTRAENVGAIISGIEGNKPKRSLTIANAAVDGNAYDITLSNTNNAGYSVRKLPDELDLTGLGNAREEVYVSVLYKNLRSDGPLNVNLSFNENGSNSNIGSIGALTATAEEYQVWKQATFKAPLAAGKTAANIKYLRFDFAANTKNLFRVSDIIFSNVPIEDIDLDYINYIKIDGYGISLSGADRNETLDFGEHKTGQYNPDDLTKIVTVKDIGTTPLSSAPTVVSGNEYFVVDDIDFVNGNGSFTIKPIAEIPADIDPIIGSVTIDHADFAEPVIFYLSIKVEGYESWYWPLYMDDTIHTGTFSKVFACYWGNTANGQAVIPSGIYEMKVNFPIARTYSYILNMHNDWSTKNMSVWLNDDSENKATFTTSNTNDTNFTGTLTIPEPGVHTIKFQGSAGLARFRIVGAAPALFNLASPLDEAENITPFSVRLNWTQNDSDEVYYSLPNGATEYKISISKSPDFDDPEHTFTKTLTSADFGGTGNSLLMTRVEGANRRAVYTWTSEDGELEYGNVKYYWKVTAINDNGGTDSPVWSFTTLEGADETPPVPGGDGEILVSHVSEISARLDWTGATDNLSPSNMIQYRVYRSESEITSLADLEDTENVMLLNANNTFITSFLDTTLQSETEYYYALTATDESGNAAMYVPKQITTPSAKPVMRIMGVFAVTNSSQVDKGMGESIPSIGFTRIHSGVTSIDINLPEAGTYAVAASMHGCWANALGANIQLEGNEDPKNVIFRAFPTNGHFYEVKGAITVDEGGIYSLVFNGGLNTSAKERIGIDWIDVYGAAPAPNFNLSSPVDNAIEVNQDNLTFNWMQSRNGATFWPIGGKSFEILIDTSEDFDSEDLIIKTGITAPASLTSSTQAAYKWQPGSVDDVLAFNTKYYWKVKAINDNGASESVVRSFTTRERSMGNAIRLTNTDDGVRLYDSATKNQTYTFNGSTEGKFDGTQLNVTMIDEGLDELLVTPTVTSSSEDFIVDEIELDNRVGGFIVKPAADLVGREEPYTAVINVTIGEGEDEKTLASFTVQMLVYPPYDPVMKLVNADDGTVLYDTDTTNQTYIFDDTNEGEYDEIKIDVTMLDENRDELLSSPVVSSSNNNFIVEDVQFDERVGGFTVKPAPDLIGKEEPYTAVISVTALEGEEEITLASFTVQMLVYPSYAPEISLVTVQLNDGEESSSPIIGEEIPETNSVKVLLRNTTDSDVNATMFMVYYKDDMLVDIKSVTAVISQTEGITHNSNLLDISDFALPDNGADRFRVFVWDEYMLPIEYGVLIDLTKK